MDLNSKTFIGKKAKPSLRYHRIIVKAGTNVLTGRSDSLDTKAIRSLATQISEVMEHGVEVILVSSGAIAAGREILGNPIKHGIIDRQVLAAVGQGHLMSLYQRMFSEKGIVVAQALLTRHDVENRQGYLNVRNTLSGLLERSVLPIINENDVVDTEEISQERFGDNDTLSSMVASLVDADLLLLLTDSGGLHTADPHRTSKASLISNVERIDESILSLAEPLTAESAGKGGMLSKLQAASRATSSGVPVVIAGGKQKNVVLKAASGISVGTFFEATSNQMEGKKRWLLSGLTDTNGEIIIDDGAIAALRSQSGSLLPAGVNTVKGLFNRGDVVVVLSKNGDRIAYGIASYCADDLRLLCGLNSNDILQKLGYHYGDAAIHRNNMVVL